MKDYEAIDVTVEDGVATVAFDRPEKKNAMNPRLLRDLGDALNALANQVRVLVVTGNGDAFNAGMDLDEYFEEARSEGPHAVMDVNQLHKRALTALYDFPQPTIAKVNGWATGGGYMVMALCDIVFAADDAQFCISEINFGIPPGGGTMWSVVNTLDRQDVMYYSLTGEPFDGERAEDLGAIHRSVPAADLDDTVAEVVEEILDKNQMALEYTKKYYDQVKHMEYARAHDYELAKGEQMKYYQESEYLDEGVGQFTNREFQPGRGETYDY
jgi:trans-feruloyl-CoA hydratase/vanillin synthase